MPLKRTVGDITIQRSGDGLETQWELIGPGGSFSFVTGADGTLPLTEAELQKIGAKDNREALYDGIWTFTPAAVRQMTVDGAIVRKHGA